MCDTKDGGNSGGANPWEMTVHLVNPGLGSIDEREVRRALALLVDPDHFVQIQALPSARYKFCRGGDLEAMVRATAELSGEKGVYFSLNPLRGGLEKAARNLDVLSRRWLLIDPDARKPDDLTRDASTTDEEKECARLVTEAIREYLRDVGWPDPIYVDSGNNWQLLYRVDLPNDKLSQQLLSKTLKSLGERFDTDRVKLDRGVHDARRICKIPGTMVRKGDGRGDRPHRMSRLMSVPMGFLSPVDIDRIKAVARIDLPQKKPAREPGEDDDLDYGVRSAELDPWIMTIGHSDDRKAYAVSALEREIGIVATATEPGRNRTLYLSALKLGTLVGADLLDEFDVKQQLLRAGQACGLGQDGDPHEVMRAINNGFGYGVQHPRQIPERPAATKVKGGNAPSDEDTRPLTDAELTFNYANVKPKTVNWLWKNRVARGFIAIFAGQTGLGKSFVACDIIARVTRGDCFPDSGGLCVDQDRALIISEDPEDFVLAPRLMELDARMDRVSGMTWEAMMQFTLKDTDMLNRAWLTAGSPCLVVIDPPTNFMGDIDEHKNTEVRGAIMKLIKWMNSISPPPAMILITHVNKAAKEVDAISRVIGSVAWVTTSRIVNVFAADPEDPNRVLFLSPKNNLGKKADGLAYRIVETETFATIEWLGVVETTADEAMNKEVKKPKQVASEDWIKGLFREKLEWPADDFWRSSREHGLSRRDVDAVRAKLGSIGCRRTVFADGSPHWVWWVPPDWPHLLEPHVEVKVFDDRPS